MATERTEICRGVWRQGLRHMEGGTPALEPQSRLLVRALPPPVGEAAGNPMFTSVEVT